jgi:hypothetical protein
MQLISCVTVFAIAKASTDCSACPLPPYQVSYHPPLRTALASHARAGSTWFRFMLERATHRPTGFEKADWANILQHVGGEEDPTAVNREGIVIKTHSSCHGCWGTASLHERLTIERNSSYSAEDLQSRFPVIVSGLQERGCCLMTGMWNLDRVFRPMINRGKGGNQQKLRRIALQSICNHPYDRAVILHRDPMDVIRSNYHYRTDVLGFREKQTWARDSHEFPMERAQSFVSFYWAWRRFAEMRPTLMVRYEDLKADPVGWMRKVIDFLDIIDHRLEVNSTTLACAVNASTMSKLKTAKQEDIYASTAANKFFGSRQDTETEENLSYPMELLQRFKDIGLLEVRELLGYKDRADVPGLDAFVRPEKPSRRKKKKAKYDSKGAEL